MAGESEWLVLDPEFNSGPRSRLLLERTFGLLGHSSLGASGLTQQVLIDITTLVSRYRVEGNQRRRRIEKNKIVWEIRAVTRFDLELNKHGHNSVESSFVWGEWEFAGTEPLHSNL